MPPLVFSNMGAFATFLQSNLSSRIAKLPLLEVAAQVIEVEAKSIMGEYQRNNMGPFVKWKELTPYTKRERLRLGYSENNPLVRSGKLRNSITHDTDVSGLEAIVGSDDQRMVYTELGTSKMPPRPVLGLAAYRTRKKVVNLLGGMTVSAFLNNDFSPFGSVIYKDLKKVP